MVAEDYALHAASSRSRRLNGNYYEKHLMWPTLEMHTAGRYLSFGLD